MHDSAMKKWRLRLELPLKQCVSRLTNETFTVHAGNHVDVRKRSAIHGQQLTSLTSSFRTPSASLQIGKDVDALRSATSAAKRRHPILTYFISLGLDRTRCHSGRAELLSNMSGRKDLTL
jgi:hypothetical protein